jgi:hypothetical protein
MAQTPTQKPATRTRERIVEKPSPARPRIQIRPATKEFDIRAAHKEWKERNGLDIDDPW